ncbi:hypothetical protein VTL71DRAFT_13640 [Oculimacula yallundae]|uniref:Uncharacterized protein n=1 Tax=Oculimacula yallundae TaxID=86028 RepID=A0ABR4CL08_9HELO
MGGPAAKHARGRDEAAVAPTKATPAIESASDKATIDDSVSIPATPIASRVESSSPLSSAPDSSPSPESSSSESAMVFNSEDMHALSFDEYIDKANRGRPSADSDDDSGTDDSPPNTSSTTLRRKLLAARKVNPTPIRAADTVNHTKSLSKDASFTSGSVAVSDTKQPGLSFAANDASPPSQAAGSVAATEAEQLDIVSAVDELLSRNPELLNSHSKAEVIEMIIRSNVIGADFDIDDVKTHHFDYAQIDRLAEAILARSTLAVSDVDMENGAGFKGLGAESMVDYENTNTANVDPIIEQQNYVLSLRNTLLDRLNACLPLSTAEALGFFELDKERAFRDKADEFKFSQYSNERPSADDVELSAALREFDREEHTLHLLKEQAKNIKAANDAANGKDTQEEIHRRNMAFLAQDDLPIPTMLFGGEDYVDRYSNDEDMAKIGHMLKKDGPLMANYTAKKEQKRKADAEEDARMAAARKFVGTHYMQRFADMNAARDANGNAPA